MTGRLSSQQTLSNLERNAMFALLNTHFHGVSRAQFDRDLAEKNWVVLVEREGELFGFSTILAYETSVAGERLCVICSGDTIVSPSAWGSAAFPKAWILSVYELRKHHPTGRLIWLLLTSGFRTYRLLPVFWREFYPRYDVATPEAWQTLLDDLAKDRFGNGFNIATGIVQFEHPQQLVGSLQDIPPSRLADEHVTYFQTRNPGHLKGDELVCVADLDPKNLTQAGRRVVYGTHR